MADDSLAQLERLARRHRANLRIYLIGGAPAASFKAPRRAAIRVAAFPGERLAPVLADLLYRVQCRRFVS